MSTTVKVSQGDTFQLIARRVFGTSVDAWRLEQANPDVREPLVAGSVLLAPDKPSDVKDRTASTGEVGPDDVTILLDGARFTNWVEVRVVRSFDSIDTAEFIAPFDPSDAAARARFQPFNFTPVRVDLGGVPLFTGTQIEVGTEVTESSIVLNVGAYAKPGVLTDCTPAIGTDLEFNKVTLGEAAERLAAPFGVSVDFSADTSGTIERAACVSTERIYTYLVRHTKQQNGVLGSTPEGVLQFRKSEPAGVPVARLEEGQSPLLSVSPAFDARRYYSHVSGIRPRVVGRKASNATAKNSYLDKFRPLSFLIPDESRLDAKGATDAKIGRMFGNAAGYTVQVSTWRDSNGQLWTPNTTVVVNAPSAMIYQDYSFLIRNVELRQTDESRTATLELVLPGSFSGNLPENLPWDL